MSRVQYDSGYFKVLDAAERASAAAIVPLVIALLQPESVCDVGCARGGWLAVFKEHGVGRVLGIDGDYVERDQLKIDESEFRAADLEQGLPDVGRFDLAVSLEVAEHLAAESAGRFVDGLATLAPAVLFSAAIPGQGGRGHVNEQWPEYWRDLFARFNPSTVTVPNGVEPLPPPEMPTVPEPDEPLRLLFVGSLNYEPNRQGLEWFAHEVAPRARERVRIDLEAVGPGARGPELPGVRYLGRLEDLGPAYDRAHAAVVPLRAGAGSRLKVLEALARGVPLVSTRIGVEGFDLHDGEQALIADDPDELAERLALLDASLRDNRQLAASLVDAGYHFAHRYFWPAIGERLAATYEAWVEDHSSSIAS